MAPQPAKKEKQKAAKKKRPRGASRRPDADAPSFWPAVLKGLLVCVLGVGLLYGAVLGVQQLPVPKVPDATALKNVEVRGEFRAVSQARVEELLLPLLAPGFFSLDVKGVKEVLEAEDWIRQAAVGRRWPQGIWIEITEEQPLAYWGEDRMLVASGKILPRPQGLASKSLPLLSGPEESVREVMERYRDLNALLQGSGMSIASLQLENAGWLLEMKSGVRMVLGTGELLQKVERFLALSKGLLAPYLDRVAGVDARYSNALAVQWKDS